MGNDYFGHDYGLTTAYMSNAALQLLHDLGFSEKEIKKGELDLLSLPENMRPTAKELLDLCILPTSTIKVISSSVFNNYARLLTGLDGDPKSFSKKDLEYYLKLRQHGLAIVDTCLKGAYECYRYRNGEQRCEKSEDNSCLDKSAMPAETLKQIGVGEMTLPSGAKVYYVEDPTLYEAFDSGFPAKQKDSKYGSGWIYNQINKWGYDVAKLNFILSKDLSKEVIEFTKRNAAVKVLRERPIGALAASIMAGKFYASEIFTYAKIIGGCNPQSDDLDQRLEYFKGGDIDLRAFSDEELSGVTFFLELSAASGVELRAIFDISERIGYGDRKQIEKETFLIRDERKKKREQLEKDWAIKKEQEKERQIAEAKAAHEERIKRYGKDHIEAEGRICKFIEKYKLHAFIRNYITIGERIGWKNTELLIHKLVDSRYPAPKGHKELDDTTIDSDTWKLLAESFLPNTDRLPKAVLKASESVEKLELTTQNGIPIHGSMICIGSAAGYAIYVTATHVIDKKHLPPGSINEYIGTDLALFAIPLREGEAAPPPLKIGKKLGEKDTFYSMGFGSNGKHLFNICTDVKYSTDKDDPTIKFYSLAIMGDSGGAVLNSKGELVGIMQAVGGAATVKSRLTTYAFGDMEVVKERLADFIDRLEGKDRR